MKKKLLNLWYTILFQFEKERSRIPNKWYFEKFNLDELTFEQLPQNIQRMIVAKDVIEQINLNIYTPVLGNYITSIYSKNDDYLGGIKEDIKSNFDKIKRCTVCALGACLLSTTKFKNKLKFSDISFEDFLTPDSEVQKMLLSIFNPYQLALIEACFEVTNYNNIGASRVAKQLKENSIIKLSTEDLQKCNKFVYNFNNSKDRLVVIMENIIQNNGEFKP